MRESPGFVADLRRELDQLTTRELAVKRLGDFNQLTVGLVRFAEETPWEIHPDGDELLYVLHGRVRVTVLPERDGSSSRSEHLGVGSLIVLQRGLWHRQTPDPEVELLFVTAAETTRHSTAPDPRRTQGQGDSSDS